MGAMNEFGLFSLDEMIVSENRGLEKKMIVSDSGRNLMSPLLNYPYLLKGYYFGICLGGKCKVRINMRDYVLSTNMVTMNLYNDIMEVQEKSDDFYIKFIFFSFDYVSLITPPENKAFPQELERNPCVQLTEPRARDFLNLYNSIGNQYRKVENPYRERILTDLLSILLGEVLALYADEGKKERKERKSSRKEELFNEFRRLVFKYHRKERAVSFYAEKMYLSPKYLSEVVKECSDRSILVWINDHVMLSSKMLLRTTSMTVAQIAEELNFSSSSHFSRFFKRYEGKTPSEYRDEAIYRKAIS